MHSPAACFCTLSYAGLAVNLVQLGSLQMRHESCVAAVQPHRGISCFFAHILRALALLPSWALPENRERWWRMPGALPLSPSQIRQRVCEGRREWERNDEEEEGEGEKEEVNRDHVPVPSVPFHSLFPALHKIHSTMRLGMFNPDLEN